MTLDERRCVKGSYFLFDVSDAYAFDLDETVELEILFHRNENDGFLISYDRNVIAEPIKQVDFEPSKSEWEKAHVQLERARFANRGQGGADFAIAALSAYWPGIPDENHSITICEMTIARSGTTPAVAKHGELDLRFVDAETSRATPVRLGIYDASGRMPLPSDAALTVRNYNDRTRQLFLRSTHGSAAPWPSENRFVFYSDGAYRARLPVGKYQLVVTKGPEYETVQRSFEISPDETTELAVGMKRWANMAAEGWYSGDDHIHISRKPEDNAEIMTFAQAEDLRVSNLLQMGNPATTHFHQYAWRERGRFVKDEHALIPGVEDPRTAIRGHTISLNIQEPLRFAAEYMQYARVFDGYKLQGALSGYAHVAGNLFHVNRGLALDVPLGAVDFVELMQDGMIDTDIWYAFMNLGFRLIPTAGSDFPYLNHPGAERSYVKLTGAFSADAWYASLAAGRTFVTNGPMLDLSVDGHPIGATHHVMPGAVLKVRATARLNPTIEKLDRLELVVHGDVVATLTNEKNRDALTLDHRLVADRGLWVAARAMGKDQAIAHTAPIFVAVGEEDSFWAPDKVPVIANAMRDRLKELQNEVPPAYEELEPWQVGSTLTSMWSAQAEPLRARIRQADAIYQRLSERALQAAQSAE